MSKRNKDCFVKVQEPISGKCYFYDFVATGRIKRMRVNKNLNGIGYFIYKYEKLMQKDVKIPRFPITRWNRH